ncbi:MAG TPA: MATE family efflux transporter [Rhizobiales bacterium]|nr:MATE family efflux transporter [Hyphomicrobiales bacterium]
MGNTNPNWQNVKIRMTTRITYKTVLAIAVPIMLSNLSEPLIGIVDTAVLGQLPQAYYIGAIAVASLIFSIVYWGFGSLRLGTGGLAAQAFGARQMTELRAVFARALLISSVIGIFIVALGPLIGDLSFWLFEASPEVERYARIYFDIRIWSAPFALANYVILGWFIGMGKTGHAFAVQLVLNLTNVALDIFFVLGLSMTADGVAFGTLLAEIIAAAFGLLLVWRVLGQVGGRWSKKRTFDRAAILNTVSVNADIMVRSLLLTFAFGFFTAQSARAGDIIIAANAILMHLLVTSAYFLDGFAVAVESLAGQAVGAGNRARFWQTVKRTSVLGFAVSVLVSIVFALVGPLFIDLLTINETVRAAARTYLVWAVMAPVIGFACFQLDGIFTGATRSKDLRNMMIISVLAYLAVWYILAGPFGNNGLWASLMIFFIIRAITLAARMPALLKALF